MPLDTLEIFGKEYTNVKGFKATDNNDSIKAYIRPQGTMSITANGTGIDVTEYAEVDVAVPAPLPTLQSKTRSYTPIETAQSETVTADTGYDGLDEVSVSVGAIPSSYVGSGVPTQAAQTITPGTSDQTIASGKYLTGTQTIKGDANLVAANIKKDVQIFGVTGTHEGGGGESILHEYAGVFYGANEGIYFNVTDSLPVAVFDEDHSPTILLSVGNEIFTLYAYFNSSNYTDGTFELIGPDTDYSTVVVLLGDCPVIQNGIIKTIHVSTEDLSDPYDFYEASIRLTIIDRRVS